MSHCRFYNTYLDLQDCIKSVEELIDNDGKNQYNEPLSKMERWAMHKMIDTAHEYAELGEQLADILDDQDN
jgi:hypothetical protein